jgi:lipopolysaccharide/colanic/teichoic acid biosynthesis glycosyltransferase
VSRNEGKDVNKWVKLLLKRALDIFLSLMGMTVLAVPFALIALAIKRDSKGPVFFRQERVGKDGKLFKVWKFRTMVGGLSNTV